MSADQEPQKDLTETADSYLTTAGEYAQKAEALFSEALTLGQSEDYEGAVEKGRQAMAQISQMESYIRYARNTHRQTLEETQGKRWFVGKIEVIEDEHGSNGKYGVPSGVVVFGERSQAEQHLGGIGFSNGNSIGQFCRDRFSYVWGSCLYVPPGSASPDPDEDDDGE